MRGRRREMLTTRKARINEREGGKEGDVHPTLRRPCTAVAVSVAPVYIMGLRVRHAGGQEKSFSEENK